MAKRRTKKWLICETLGCSQQRQGHIVPKPTDAVRLETQRVVILSEIQHVVRGSLYRAAGSGERRTLGSVADLDPRLKKKGYAIAIEDAYRCIMRPLRIIKRWF